MNGNIPSDAYASTGGRTLRARPELLTLPHKRPVP